jgi:cold shock CspA family protein
MPEGRIKFYREDRHYGFIVFESVPGSGKFDNQAYFHASVLRSHVEAGSWIWFETEEDSKVPGKHACTYISAVERQSGTVIEVDEHGFYHIRTDATGDVLQASYREIIPDSICRRYIPVGSRVSFRLSDAPDKRVSDIENEDAGVFDLENYFEDGVVEVFNESQGYGHIRRSSGDTIAFVVKNIISEGYESVRVGTWLRFQIYSRKFAFSDAKCEFYHNGFAHNISVFVEPGSAEDHFLNAQELPLDPPPSERLAPGDVYTPSEKRMTIRQLITRK